MNMMDADEINATIKKAEAALKAAQAKVATERAAIESEVKTQPGDRGRVQTPRAPSIVAAMDNKGAIDTFQRIAKVRGTAVARAEGERCTRLPGSPQARRCSSTCPQERVRSCSATAATGFSTSSAAPRTSRHATGARASAS